MYLKDKLHIFNEFTQIYLIDLIRSILNQKSN